jgi:hypothetical protein
VGIYGTPSEMLGNYRSTSGESGEDLLLTAKASDASMTIPRNIEGMYVGR